MTISDEPLISKGCLTSTILSSFCNVNTYINHLACSPNLTFLCNIVIVNFQDTFIVLFLFCLVFVSLQAYFHVPFFIALIICFVTFYSSQLPEFCVSNLLFILGLCCFFNHPWLLFYASRLHFPQGYKVVQYHTDIIFTSICYL